jgi:hypothetical protein
VAPGAASGGCAYHDAILGEERGACLSGQSLKITGCVGETLIIIRGSDQGGALGSGFQAAFATGKESWAPPGARGEPQTRRSEREPYSGERLAMRIVSSTAIPRRDGTPMLPFDANLASLLTRIPKSEGTKTRPIGVPTCEDKVLQRAVLTGLEVAHEQDFLDCSYGFPPG